MTEAAEASHTILPQAADNNDGEQALLRGSNWALETLNVLEFYLKNSRP